MSICLTGLSIIKNVLLDVGVRGALPNYNLNLNEQSKFNTKVESKSVGGSLNVCQRII